MARIFTLLAALLVAMHAVAFGAQDMPALLLVANETIDDPNFARTVILATRQPDGGVLGFILNRPTDISLREVFPKLEGLKEKDEVLYLGGPVMPQAVAFLFHADEPPPKAVQVLQRIFLSGDAELLFRLLQRAHPTERLRVFVGYAGWAPGQLEHELSRGDWQLLPADDTVMFHPNPLQLWRELNERVRLRSTRWFPKCHGQPECWPSGITAVAHSLATQHARPLFAAGPTILRVAPPAAKLIGSGRFIHSPP